MTAPLPGAPQVITPAMRAADDAGRDQARAERITTDAAYDEWLKQARERIHNRTPWWLAADD